VTVDVIDAIAPLAAEWDALANRAGAPPFLRPGWFAAWWAAFGTGELRVLTARRDGRLAGVLPVRRRGGVLASPTNAHTPGFGAVAEDVDAVRELGSALFAERPRRVQLDYVDVADGALPVLQGAATGGRHRVLRTTVQRSPYLTLVPGEDVDRRLGGKVAGNLRRLLRRLRERGEVEVDVSDGRARLGELLDEGFRLEASGWKTERGTAINASPVTRRFYDDLGRWAATTGLLRLCFLRLDGRALAFAFTLHDGAAHYVIKGGYDPAERRFAPGKQLTRALVARAAADGLERFEFLGAEESWKLEWTDQVHERLLVRTFAPTPRGAVERAAQAAYLHYGKPLARRALAHLR
jgi:CelD/BcsL family acetyltransferase involved in cellulose biosynthesis